MFFESTKGNFFSLTMVIISLSGWTTSVYLYNDLLRYQLRVSEGKIINAYNILASAFKRSISEDEIYSTVNDWVLKGDSAEVGSLTTMCDNNPSVLVKVSPAFTETSILRVCSTIKR